MEEKHTNTKKPMHFSGIGFFALKFQLIMKEQKIDASCK